MLPKLTPSALTLALATTTAAAQTRPTEPLASPQAGTQSIEVHLVDGRNGRAMVGKGSHVNFWTGEKRNAVVIGTQLDGVARVELTSDPARVDLPTSPAEGLPTVANPILLLTDTLSVNAPFAWCAPGGSQYSWLAVKHLSTQDVLQHGYVSPNTCGKTTSSAKPGQIIIFVRPLTFWESFKE